jgi:hypothetical protein
VRFRLGSHDDVTAGHQRNQIIQRPNPRSIECLGRLLDLDQLLALLRRAVPFAYTGAAFALARALSSAVGGLSVGLFWEEVTSKPQILNF